MSLYPGWGVGGRIKLAGWTRKLHLRDGDDDGVVTVVFNCERDSVERFGSFRSMDILRLWMATGLDTVATEFFKEVESNTREMELKRRKIEGDVMDKVKEALNEPNFVIYTTKSFAANSSDPNADTFSIYKYEKQSKNMSDNWYYIWSRL